MNLKPLKFNASLLTDFQQGVLAIKKGRKVADGWDDAFEKVKKQYADEWMPALDHNLREVEKEKTALKEELKIAKDRAAQVSSVREISGFKLFKWFNGVSDALKNKCLPLNKQTQDYLLAASQGWLLKTGPMAGIRRIENLPNAVPRQVIALPDLDKLYKTYIKPFNDCLPVIADYASACTNGLNVKKEKELKAMAFLEKYLKEKGGEKEVGGATYKAFKAKYKKISETL